MKNMHVLNKVFIFIILAIFVAGCPSNVILPDLTTTTTVTSTTIAVSTSTTTTLVSATTTTINSIVTTTTTTVSTSTTTTLVPLSGYEVTQPLSGSLGIIKVHYRGYSNDNTYPNNEYVVISSSGSIDISGYTLSDVVGHTHTFPANSIVNTSLTVYTGSGTDSSTIQYWGNGAAIWNNDTDVAYLRDSGGELVDALGW